MGLFIVLGYGWGRLNELDFFSYVSGIDSGWRINVIVAMGMIMG